SVAILPSALVVEHLLARCQLGVSRFSGCCNLNLALWFRVNGSGAGAIPQSPELGDLLWYIYLSEWVKLREQPADDCSETDHKLRRSSTACATAPPAFVPPLQRLASWRSCRLVRTSSGPSGVDHSRSQRGRECSALLAPASFSYSCHPPC